MATVAILDILFNADTGGAVAAMGNVQDAMFRTAIAGKKIGDPIVSAVKSWVNSAIDLETNMNNVNSIAKVSQGQLNEWTDDVQQMSVQWGQSSVDTASGLYDIQSAGFSASDSIKILESSSMAARAGLSTVAVASDAVTTVMKAYENQIDSTSAAYQKLTDAGDQAEYIQNVLFRGVDVGKVTYDQLAGAMGNSIATAATVGVTFEETTAAIALMSQQGLSADEASTALNNTMLAFINPSEAMTAAVQSMGYENAQTMIQTEGLAGAMQMLEDYTHGDASAIAELFTNIRSRRGAMLLMNGDLADMVEQMNNAQASGDKLSAMQSALDEQTKSTSFAIDVVKASIEVMGQELVQSFLPVIRAIAYGISTLAQIIVSLPAPIKTFMGAFIGLFGAIMSAVGAIALAYALFQPIIGLLLGLTLAAAGAAAAFAALFAIFSTFGFRDVIQGFSDMVDALDIPFLDHFTNSVERAAEAWHTFMNIGAPVLGLSGITADIGALGNALIAFADSTSGIDFLDGPLGELGDFLTTIAKPLQDALDLYKELRHEEDTSGPAGTGSGAGGAFQDKYQYSQIQSLRKAWSQFNDDMLQQFPKQKELIGQVDGAVGGLLDSIESAQMGNWDQAWDQFSAAAESGWEAVKTVGSNIKNAFTGIDWGAVYDSIGGALDGIFAQFTDLSGQLINWTLFTGIPAVEGWLVDHAGDAWEAIKGIAGWAFDRATEVIDWVIDVAMPGIQGAGQHILGNLKNWLIGQIQGAATGDGTGGPEAAGDLGSMSLGSLAVKWSVEVLEPAFKSVVNDVKGWIIGKLSPGGTVPSPGIGTGIGASGSGMGSYDLGTVTATWAINVLEPTLAGWISGGAGWLQDKLQSYVNGAAGGSGPAGTGSGAGSAFGGGGGGGGLVQLANWAIDVLEPLVNLTGAGIGAKIQLEIDSLLAGLNFAAKGINLVISQITSEQVSSTSDIPGAIQLFIDNTQREYTKVVDLTIWVDDHMSFGGGGAEGAYAQGGFHGMGEPGGGRVQAWIDANLPNSVSKHISAIVSYDLENDGLPALWSAIGDLKTAWEHPETYKKIINLGIDLVFPGWLQDLAGKGLDFLNFLPSEFGKGLQSLVDFYNEYNQYLEDENKNSEDAGTKLARTVASNAHSIAMAGAYANNNVVRTGQAPPQGVGTPRQFSTPPPPVTPPPIPDSPVVTNGTPITTLPRTGAGSTAQFADELQKGAQNAATVWDTAIQQIPQQTQTQARAILPAFNTGFSGFSPAVQQGTRNVVSVFDTGIQGMPIAATTQAGATVGSMGIGLAPMPVVSGAAGLGASDSLRGGVAPMAGYGQAAGVSTVIQTGGALAPLPGITGSAGTNSGNSFATGIAGGMYQAVVAAQVGVAGIMAAVNSVGDLSGVGFGIGASFGAGLVAGLTSMLGAVAAASAALVSAAANAATAKGEISSPSRLFAREIGAPIGQGIAVGIESEQGTIRKVVDKAIDFNAGTGTYTLPRSKVVAVYNTHQYVLEPDAWLQVQKDSKMSAEQLRDMNSRSRQLVRSKPQVR